MNRYCIGDIDIDIMDNDSIDTNDINDSINTDDINDNEELYEDRSDELIIKKKKWKN